MVNSNVIFAKLKDFSVDVERLRESFKSLSNEYKPMTYRDNQVNYLGWAVTSRDGSIYDGIRRINLKSNNSLNRKKGREYTEICKGYLRQVMEELSNRGLDPFRARLMQLESEGDEMPFHTDSKRESWRLHIPIITNDDSFFEWEREDGTIESVNLPANGSAWLVRVDIRHRAVNRAENKNSRVHLLMGCNKKPSMDMLTDPFISY